MKRAQTADIDTVLRIYYTYPEISTAQVKEIFPSVSSSTLTNYKKHVKMEMAKKGVKVATRNAIDTETAFKVWGIDVQNLEKRRAKLKKLGLSM